MNEQEATLLAMKIIELFQRIPPQTASDVMMLRGILVEMLAGKDLKPQKPEEPKKKGFNWGKASDAFSKQFG